MKSVTLQVLDLPLAELLPFHRNPRRGDVEALKASLERHGQYKPIVVNAGSLTGRPNEILAGNHTFAAAKALGWESMSAVLVDVDEERAAAIVLADNRIADLGGYDDADLLAVLQEAGDLSGTGYSSTDLAALLRELDEPVALTDEDDAPDLAEGDPISAPGDVWQLGVHRLLVGDAADLDGVRAMLDGDVPDAVWTDPPYGVQYVGKTDRRLSIQNDGSFSEAAALVASAMGVVVDVCRPGAPVYVAHPEQGREEFLAAMRAAGVRVRQTFVWVKDSLVLGRSDYHYRHEPVLYGFTPGGSGRLGRGGVRWFGDNKQSTVFEVPRPKRSAVHPTMKPVELIERMLRNSCPPGGTVLDLFAGSGTTMIAAHHLGMIAVLVEFDPRYADVICRRWQEHTGVVPMRNGVEVDFTEAADA
ncbi:DNA modification methylase [Agromyces larvae]|uniref:DNA modification methylase n=1 Tax=Agromyces larvae TaxID=2929802 RepID=A0ABY4C1Y0_9MICO|nr:DNA modification methylase [Agromyces larvae]UOE45485.1 DNA modification methylase [Agromyces larvae]